MVDILSVMRKQDIKGLATRLGISTEQYISKSNANLKWCNTYKKWLEEKDFYKSKYGADGRHSTCIACNNKLTKAYKRANKEKISVQRKTHRQTLFGKFQAYKEKAQARGFDFDISFDGFQFFWQKPCSYCGSKIETVGIDRVDNNKGYDINNCVPCCEVCNKMKWKNSKDFWLEHVKKILKHKGII